MNSMPVFAINSRRPAVPIFVAVAVLLTACGKKEEAPVAKGKLLEVVCAYSPSKSDAVQKVVAFSGGAGVAAVAVAKAAGLTAVLHSSGAYIFTGASGYVAGTLVGAAAVPIAVGVAVAVGGPAIGLELTCASTNHPAAVKMVEDAAVEALRLVKGMVGA